MDFPSNAYGKDRDIVHIGGKGSLALAVFLYALHLFFKKGARKGDREFTACDDGARDLNGRATTITELNNARAQVLRKSKYKIMKRVTRSYGPIN